MEIQTMKTAMANTLKSRNAWLLALLLAACGQQVAQNTAPVEITRETACSLDGMTLADYPGPKAQILYDGQPNPEYFCDLLELFDALLKPEQTRKVTAAYVQDMGQAEWEEPKGHWIDAETTFYVVGSKKMGSMGPTFGSFAKENDAKKFAAANGGKVYKFGEITLDMVSLDGGALHDQQM
jgi:copper chaperone NosL